MRNERTFGKVLERLIAEKGITRREFAARIGVTDVRLYLYICGDKYPDIIMAKRMADVLGVTLDDMVSEVEIWA